MEYNYIVIFIVLERFCWRIKAVGEKKKIQLLVPWWIIHQVCNSVRLLYIQLPNLPSPPWIAEHTARAGLQPKIANEHVKY